VSSQQSDQICPALEMLDRGNQYKLVLLTAPSGAGKARLIRQWSKQNEKTFCCPPLWIVVDNKTKQLSGFLEKLANGITMWDQNFEANAEAYRGLYMQQSDSGANEPNAVQGVSEQLENILIQLLNRLMHLPGDRFIIIENYHTFHDPMIHTVIGYLIDFLPPNMHLIITSQDQPALPIPRLRARRELIEIQPEDLKSVPK
jgi:LuxR family maltose regulon positive regulatory protein